MPAVASPDALRLYFFFFRLIDFSILRHAMLFHAITPLFRAVLIFTPGMIADAAFRFHFSLILIDFAITLLISAPLLRLYFSLCCHY